MSRDYKPRKTQPKRKTRGGTLLGVFIGLVLGVLIAFGVVLYLNKTPLPFNVRGAKSEEKAVEPQVMQPQPAAPVATAPQPLPGKPGDKVTEKPRFEFYKILPQDSEETPAPPAVVKTEPAANEAFYLQAGAFQSAADADNLKAKLALMGLEASIQRASTQGKGVLHRVRLGPFRSQDDVARVRNQLQQNGIQASVVRVKEGA